MGSQTSLTNLEGYDIAEPISLPTRRNEEMTVELSPLTSLLSNPASAAEPAAEPGAAASPEKPAQKGLVRKAPWGRFLGRGRTKPRQKPRGELPENGVAAAENSNPEAPSDQTEATRSSDKSNPDPSATSLNKKRTRRNARWAIPAWGLSIIVHVVILSLLAFATLNEEIRKKLVNLNTSMIKDPAGSAAELTKIYADPSDAPRDQATGDEASSTSGQGRGDAPPSSGLALAGGGLAGASTTPQIAAVGTPGKRGSGGAGAGTGLSNLKVVSQVSGLSIIPPSLTKDLGGGGKIAGEVAFEAGEIGEALDQLSREILRHLNEHKLTVVWLFDESESMLDDQKIVKQKFNRVAVTLKQQVDSDRKSASALTHVIVGFGKDTHFVINKPTADIDAIGKAIDHLRVDPSGIENTCQAIQTVINRYGGIIGRDRRLLIVVVTDESGDDGTFIEEARQMAVSRRVPIYVLGRQAVFGFPFIQFQYIDPVTKDVFYPTIRRGPETAGLEALQWDGLGGRIDEVPSGFAPYELARLTKDTGGIYFLLPSEETMRIRQREKAYSIKTLKEYVPDYESRNMYEMRRQKSDLRRTLFEIIEATRSGDFNYRLAFPVMPNELVAAASEELKRAGDRLKKLLVFEERLRKLQTARDRETEKRWQASYDLILAEMVAYQIKCFEYQACLKELIKKRPKPTELPNPKLVVEWHLGHNKKPKAPESETSKKYAEANRLYQLVLDRHPKTPWADLAQDEINRGFSVGWGEAKWRPSTTRAGRAKFVPNQ